MNLTGVRYTYSRFATTNPPQNISHTLDLHTKQGGGVELEKSDYTNGLCVTKIYAVPSEKLAEISALFESLNILGAINRKFIESAPAPEMPPMAGGGENRAITFFADKISIACFYLPDEANPLVARLTMLADECGEPIFETKTGSDMNAPGYDALAAAEQVVAQMEAIKKAAEAKPVLAEGEWLCSGCGHVNANSKFCTECGKIRD